MMYLAIPNFGWWVISNEGGGVKSGLKRFFHPSRTPMHGHLCAVLLGE